MSWEYGLGSPGGLSSRLLYVMRFFSVALGYSALIVIFFAVLGGFVGQYMKQLPSLRGYGINLAGGLAGMALFSLLAFFHLGPAAWLLLGFFLLAPLFARDRLTLVALAAVVCAVAIPEPNTFWSPYYRIELTRLAPPDGWPRASAYALVANHVWYQWFADLSPDFLQRYPTAKPNSLIVPYYELPYRIVPHPQSVLILGAGTGNDVAGALRHGDKAVTQLSLLFGATWIVNSVVIAAFLAMALVANALAGTCRVSAAAMYGILIVLLIADFWFPYSAINSLSAGAKFFVGGGWAALPVFFSGIVFSTSLQRFGRPAKVLGVNLLGAVLGGLLENAVMIGGTPILKALALGMYAVSAVALFRSRSQVAA